MNLSQAAWGQIWGCTRQKKGFPQREVGGFVNDLIFYGASHLQNLFSYFFSPCIPEQCQDEEKGQRGGELELSDCRDEKRKLLGIQMGTEIGHFSPTHNIKWGEKIHVRKYFS